MANRFPLVLDTDAGNKIKELPSGDNLNLRESSIVNVQDVTALGTINAADIRVNGNRLVAQSFADLTDTPNTFAGAADYFVKVKEDGTGLEFRPFSDIGNIEVEQIEVSDVILPTVDNAVDIGSNSIRFRTVTAVEFKGDLLANDESKVFDAATGFISYAALQGAPQFLSEFTDDIGFLRTNDLDSTLSGLFDEGVPFSTDIVGSVFADDSSILVDSVNGKIVGEVDTFIVNTSILTSQAGLGNINITGGVNAFGGSVNITGGTGTFERGGSISINGGNGLTADGFVNIGQSSDEVRIDGNDLFLGTVVGNINLGRAGSTTTVFGTFDFTNATAIGTLDGELTGSVYYDDSTQIIDAVAGRIVNPIISGTANFEDNVIIDQNLTVLGNLIVQGTTTSLETTNTTITDNIIVLNEGEIGAGVTAGSSGIEIDRGLESNVTLLWNETIDKWTIGTETFVANRFESVGVAASIFDSPEGTGLLQIKAGAVDDTGNVIFINPYGSDTFIISRAETHTWNTGPYLSAGNPYIDFKTAGAFKAHDGAYFEGNLTGDVIGSVFSDDSTLLIDGVNGVIRGDLASTRWTTDGYTNITVNGFLEMRPQFFQLNAQADGYMQFNAGDGNEFGAGYMVFNAGDGGSSTSGFGGYIQINAGDGSGSDAGGGGYVQIEAGNGSGIGSLGGGYVSIAAGNAGGGDLFGGYVSIAAGDSSGNEVGAYTQISAGDAENGTGGEVRIYGGTSLNGNGGDVIIEGGLAGGSGTEGKVRIVNAEITGNIDNTTLDIGTTTATAINIGNSNSTTTVAGTIQFTNALIANNLTADDSISITTAVGDGNAISLGPQGTNTFVNLTADSIRFFGPVTTNISATGGITGDVKGSVFGDDSSVIIDAVNNNVNASTITATSGISVGDNVKATFGNSSDLQIYHTGIVDSHIDNINPGGSTIISGQNLFIQTRTGSILAAFYAGTGSATLRWQDVQKLETRDFGINVDGEVRSTSLLTTGNINVGGDLTVAGRFTADVVGSIFADDSSVMVDAVNFTMFSDILTLTPLTAEPINAVAGMLVTADGVSWDPGSKAGAVPYPVFYDGVAWNALY